MRTIEISTSVYARIWSHRLSGEENEDAILRRLLGAEPTNEPAIVTKSNQQEVKMKVLWREDVKTALEALGGVAPLSAIYKEVRNIRLSGGRRLPPSLDAIVRRELEYNSSDSESFTNKYDWFKSAEGIGAGVWALR